jgi:hypothetical protein
VLDFIFILSYLVEYMSADVPLDAKRGEGRWIQQLSVGRWRRSTFAGLFCVLGGLDVMMGWGWDV